MVSISPNTLPFINSHMYSFNDLRPCVKKTSSCYCPNSIMDIINTNQNFTKFRFIIKLAGLDITYDSQLANYTLFVPSDAALSKIPEGVFLNMDIGTARNIVKTATLKNKITFDLIKDSPISSFLTLNDSEKLLITNISGVTNINNCIRLIKPDILACNGVIHVTNDIIWPYNHSKNF